MNKHDTYLTFRMHLENVKKKKKQRISRKQLILALAHWLIQQLTR